MHLYAFLFCTLTSNVYYITLHYITLHYITLHYITLHYITLHYITLYYIILYYIILYYIILYYIILYYIILYYIILYYISSFGVVASPSLGLFCYLGHPDLETDIFLSPLLVSGQVRLGCDQLTSGSPLHLPLPRLENTQYDASNGVGDDEEFGQSPMTSASPSLTSWSSESRKQAQEDNTGD